MTRDGVGELFFLHENLKKKISITRKFLSDISSGYEQSTEQRGWVYWRGSSTTATTAKSAPAASTSEAGCSKEIPNRYSAGFAAHFKARSCDISVQPRWIEAETCGPHLLRITCLSVRIFYQPIYLYAFSWSLSLTFPYPLY